MNQERPFDDIYSIINIGIASSSCKFRQGFILRIFHVIVRKGAWFRFIAMDAGIYDLQV